MTIYMSSSTFNVNYFPYFLASAGPFSSRNYRKKHTPELPQKAKTDHMVAKRGKQPVPNQTQSALSNQTESFLVICSSSHTDSGSSIFTRGSQRHTWTNHSTINRASNSGHLIQEKNAIQGTPKYQALLSKEPENKAQVERERFHLLEIENRVLCGSPLLS